tara:strand:- start:4005 stop:6977 length:2973 start_codon:yes stop_codon:yes gene_type:complete
MSGFRNATVFGLKIGFNLSELRQDANDALRNLNLEPNDFRRLQNIGDVENGIPNTFQKISKLSENLLLKSDSMRSETSAYTGVLDRLFQTSTNLRGVFFRPIDGNLNINGRLIAKSITQKTFDETSKTFVTSPITTAINSAWDTTGTTISLGQGLVIESNANAKVVTGRLKNVQAFESRRFGTEKATHKIKIKIGGTDYFMYAIKNNPFKLEGSFGNATKETLQITTDPVGDINYVASEVNNSGVTVERPVVKVVANEPAAEDAIANLQTGSVLNIYADPEKVSSFVMKNQGLTELPEGIKFGTSEDTTPELVDISDNAFETFPAIKKTFPDFKRVIISQDPAQSSKIRKIVITNFDDISNNLPTGITEFKAKASFKADTLIEDVGSPDFPADFSVAPFASLENLDLSHNLFTGIVPKMRTGLITLNLGRNKFTKLTEDTLTSALTDINLSDNDGLKVDDDTPIESHPYYNNNTYNAGLTHLQVHRTSLGIPDLQNKLSLTTFNGEVMSYDGAGTETNDVRFQIVSTIDDASTSKFKNCTALTEIKLRSSRLHGPIPSFASNTLLNELNLEGTGLINPTGNALAPFGFPEKLRSFKYVYSTNFGEFTAAGGTSNTLPSSAFQYEANDSDFTPTLIPFTTLTYRSKGITGGQCPALKGINVDVSENAFTSIVPIEQDSVDEKIATFKASDNKLQGPLNLNALFSGSAEFESLTEINLSNNDFDSFSNSIQSTKFTALTNLLLKNSFTDDTPTNLILPAFTGLSTLETIDVSENDFDNVESNIFNGCSSLTSFSIDTTSFGILSSIIGSIESLLGGATSDPAREFVFASSGNAKVNMKIPLVNTFGKNTYTAEEQDFFNMNDRIRALEEKNVSINNVELDEEYAALPDPPSNLVASNTAPGECTLTFDAMTGVDRIIIIKVRDGVDVEISGTIDDSPPGLPGNTTTFVDTGFDDTRDARYKVHGENIRSIIGGVINEATVESPIPDSPPNHT